MRDIKDYIESLKELVNLEFQYAVKSLGDTFASQIRQLAQENSVLGEEVKKILGDTFTLAAHSELFEAREHFVSRCRQAQEEGVLLCLEYLLDIFGANEFEKHCVRFMFAFELEKSYVSLAALLQDGWENGYVTPYLAKITYGEEVDDILVYETFSEGSLLQRFFLKTGIQNKSALLNKVELSNRIVDFSMGNVSVYPKYTKFLKRWNSKEATEPWLGKGGSSLSFLEEVLEKKDSETGRLLYLYGEEGSGKRFSVLKACQKHEENCFVIDLNQYQKAAENLDYREEASLLDALVREIFIFQAVPMAVVSGNKKEEIQEIIDAGNSLLKTLPDFFSVTFLVAEQKVHLDKEFPATYLFMEPMSLLEGKEFWEKEGRKYLLEEGISIGSMANKFQLTRGKIKRILENAEKKRQQRKEAFISKDSVTEECYEVIEQSMGKRAVKVPSAYQMKDLILPPKQKKQLIDACNQVKYKHKVYEEWGFQEKISYGKGVSMAFIGPPGTGKTMAAQVIAKELGMELYKVELSCVVSKYVGETEKNLDEIFEQAKKSQVILFFDEADALFNKRSEGKETADKYSNMEAAFLLQKMEAYDGITVLATNLFHHFDEAFKRRLKVIVEFPLPNEKDRKQLWQTMIPDKMEIGEVDFDYLAKQFELSGSNIRNILLHSAFLAAAKDKPMDMEEIIPAIKNEYAKNGKNLLKEDVSEYYMYLD